MEDSVTTTFDEGTAPKRPKDVAVADAELSSDHALLQRGQDALKSQLLEIKQDLIERVREKQRALKDVQALRQQHGVELYGLQERLADLQKKIEASQSRSAEANEKRKEAEERLEKVRADVQSEEEHVKTQKAKAHDAQTEFDRLSAALKQIESYNDEMRDQLSVAQREAEATESASRKTGKEKTEQDYLIVDLQRSLKRRQDESETLQSQLNAQISERRAAEEVLAEAQRDMENVHYEKKQLVALWKSSLVHLQQKDETLQKVEQSLREREQRVAELENEQNALTKEFSKTQESKENIEATIAKISIEAEAASARISQATDKRDGMSQTATDVEDDIRGVNAQLEQAESEAKDIEDASENCRRRYVKISKDTQDLHDVVLAAMHEQTTMERSANKALSDIRKTTKEKQKSEMHAIELRNDLAKLQVDLLNTQGHNIQLKETLSALEAALEERAATVEHLEMESKKREGSIEKQTRELDALNRRYQQLTEDLEDESTGPLEATIHNLRHEIQAKGSASQELQKRWMQQQVALVTMENQNSRLAESLSLMHSKTTIMKQKKRRLETQLEQNLTSLKTLKTSMDRLHKDIQSLNGVIAKNEDMSKLLESQTFVIESEIEAEMKEMKSEAHRLESVIDQTTEEKRDGLSEIVQTEKQIMIWQRKLELEREMQAALEPDVGQDVAQSLRQEIHRMELKHRTLLQQQESLIREMEMAIQKRQNIRFKNEALKSRDSTESEIERACQDLRRNIHATKKEIDATEIRIRALQEQRAQLISDLQSCGETHETESQRLEDIQRQLHEALQDKAVAFMKTLVFQRIVKKLEAVQKDASNLPLSKQGSVTSDLSKATSKSTAIRAVLASKCDVHASRRFAQSLGQLDALDAVYD